LGMARTKFDSCAHDSMNAFVSTAQSGGLVPSFAHGMAVPGAVAGAITDVATNYFNSKTSPAEGKAQLMAAIQAAM
jgi:glucose/mannose transport system substrate-binding protein